MPGDDCTISQLVHKAIITVSEGLEGEASPAFKTAIRTATTALAARGVEAAQLAHTAYDNEGTRTAVQGLALPLLQM